MSQNTDGGVGIDSPPRCFIPFRLSDSLGFRVNTKRVHVTYQRR